MNKFFSKFIVIFILLIGQINASERPMEVSSTKDVCLAAIASKKVPQLTSLAVKACISNDDVLQELLESVNIEQLPPAVQLDLKAALVQKTKEKLFPLDILVPMKTLFGHTATVTSVAISSDGGKILSGSLDKTVRLWNLIDNKTIELFDLESGVGSVAMNSAGTKGLFTLKNNVIMWDLVNGEESILNVPTPITSIAMNSAGTKGLAGYNRNIAILDLVEGIKESGILHSKNDINSVAMTYDGTKGLIGSNSGSELWNLNTKEEISPIDRPNYGFITSVSLSENGKFGLYSSGNSFFLWNFNTAKTKRIFSEYVNMINSVAITADGSLGILSLGKAIKVWDLAGEKEIVTLYGHLGSVETVAITPDGSWAVSGSEDKTIKVWDLRPLLVERFSIEWLREIYQQLYQGNKKQSEVYQWIINKFKELDQAKERAQKQLAEQRQKEQSAAEERPQEGTGHQEKRKKYE